MTTQLNAQIDQFLTQVSQQIMPLGYISEEILPLVQVAQYTGKIAKYRNDHLRLVNDVAGGKEEYAMVETDVRSSDLYSIETHALKVIVTDEDFRNVIRPFDARRDAVKKLTTHLWIGKEKSLADALGDTAVITNNVILAGNQQYNDYTNSTPLQDFSTARCSVYENCGAPPDLAIMSWKVKNVLRYHPQLLDALGYKEQRPGGLSDEELARALDVERVLVGTGVFNNAKQGQADSIEAIWGKNIVFTLSPRNAELMQKSLGYRLQLGGVSPRQVFRESLREPVGAEKIIVLDKYEQLLTDNTCAYLIKDAIA